MQGFPQVLRTWEEDGGGGGGALESIRGGPGGGGGIGLLKWCSYNLGKIFEKYL